MRLRVDSRWLACLLLIAAFYGGACSSPSTADRNTVNFLIESMPANLDPRLSFDAQSERINSLIFSGLLERDARMNLRGDLAERWEVHDPFTYVFHLRPGVRFQDGRTLSSADVKYTFDSVLNGSVPSPKRGTYRMVSAVDAPDALTVIFHLKEPYASFLERLTRNAMGIVPVGSDGSVGAHPIGSGPFRLVTAHQDEDVLLQRNPSYFRTVPQIDRVRFRIVPDAVVRALELRKGTADLEMSSLNADMVPVLASTRNVSVAEAPGTNYSYIAVNFEQPELARREVRQALAYATDRESIIRYLLRGQARVADGPLPPGNWAYEPNTARYPYDPARARHLLDTAGFIPRTDLHGMRLRLVLKTSTQESSRLLGAVLQEQWRQVGIDLEVRSIETATLFSDITRGNFQLAYLRWVGENDDPDIFDFVFHSRRWPPNGANRGHYRNPTLDALLDQARVEPDTEKRKRQLSQVQTIVANDLPYLSLWYNDVVSVHSQRVQNVALTPTGDYDFLTGIVLK